MHAIITDILKKDEGVTFYYKVGDEHQSSSYYPKNNTLYGDGIILFFTGSPATMRMSVSFHGERVAALDDISLEMIRAKVKGA